jgi:hypothetical protein
LYTNMQNSISDDGIIKNVAAREENLELGGI